MTQCVVKSTSFDYLHLTGYCIMICCQPCVQQVQLHEFAQILSCDEFSGRLSTTHGILSDPPKDLCLSSSSRLLPPRVTTTAHDSPRLPTTDLVFWKLRILVSLPRNSQHFSMCFSMTLEFLSCFRWFGCLTVIAGVRPYTVWYGCECARGFMSLNPSGPF